MVDGREPCGFAYSEDNGLCARLFVVGCELGSGEACGEFDWRCGLLPVTLAGSPTEEALDRPSSMEDLWLEALEVDIPIKLLAFVGEDGWKESLLRELRMKSSIFTTDELAVGRERRFVEQ